jgi:hypothetical protein
LYGAAAMLPKWDDGAIEACATGAVMVVVGAVLAIRVATSGVNGGASVLG